MRASRAVGVLVTVPALLALVGPACRAQAGKPGSPEDHLPPNIMLELPEGTARDRRP